MTNKSRNHRNKNPHPRRVQVTDEDGWTHISNTNSIQSSTSMRRKKKQPMTDGAADDSEINSESLTTAGRPSLCKSKTNYTLSPSETPPSLTLDGLRKTFQTHSQTWKSSQTWQQLKATLSKDVFGSSGIQLQIENIVCIGLGSPSGFVQGGWVDRRSVALYQLAALVSMIDLLRECRQQNENPQRCNEEIGLFAQDPVFNALDIQLFASLGIEVVSSPQGFNAVTANTFLFAPGAERRHLSMILPCQPILFFGGPLEEGPSLATRTLADDRGDSVDHTEQSDDIDDWRILAQYAAHTRSANILQFESRPETFWRMRLYWRDLAGADTGNQLKESI